GLSLQPNFTAMRVGLAKTLIKQGRPVEAAQELRRVLREREPENPADWAMQDRPQASRLLDSIAG
ncbi:MAG TPA: tetratricopeptide repeat protein, partial [Candidatus Sulfotelmatobacter sp.]|nr:tetratricopeptide repeat protein [Candidatus Sulfotelmatobacter sp.]